MIEYVSGVPASAVYFLQAEGSGRIKIGFSSTPLARIRNIRASSPERLNMVALVPGGRDKESELHRRFASARLHGEWFDSVPDLVYYINSHADETRRTVSMILSGDFIHAWSRPE